MNFDKQDPLNILPTQLLNEPPSSLVENLTTAFDVYKYDGGPGGANSSAFAAKDIWDPIIDIANENGGNFENPGIYLTSGFLTPAPPSSVYETKAQTIYSWLNENKETLPVELQNITPEVITERTRELVESKKAELEVLAKTNPDLASVVARFIGGMATGLGDPVTAYTAPFAATIKGGMATASFWKGVMKNAAINAGAGAITEVSVANWYDELDLDYTYADFLRNVAFQGAFGAALPVGARGIQMTTKQARKGWEVLTSKGGKPVDPEDQALVDLVKEQEEVVNSNPLETPEDPNVAELEHQNRLVEAQAAVENNTLPNISPEPISPIKGTIPLQDELNALMKRWWANNAKLKAAEAEGLKIQRRLDDAFDVNPNLTKDSKVIKDLIDENKLNGSEVEELQSIQDGLGKQRVKILEKQEQQLALVDNGADNLDGVIFKYDPDEIDIDAKTFQFKSGGDEFGVTKRLQGAVWDKNLAGTITVYEYADGRLVVSDGHQRLGLAKRIKAQDPSQEIKLYAYKEREVDGISPIESRVNSAIKNIANTPADARDPQLVIDAAKVLREATGNPNISTDVIDSLPPQSQIVKQARGLMLLGDDAFMSVVNEVIPPNYAAIVGRLIDDQNLQSAAISVLAKSNPSNAFEAEAIIRQVRESDFEQVKQIDLFGEKIVTESYFVERAKILDKAYKELRKDKAAFETLVRNSERLEAEGNVLVKEANKKKADTDGQTIALLQTLANRKGPLSDALNQAARTARDTGSYVEATRGFLDSVRGSIESGDFERISSGDIGRAVDGTPQIARSEIAKEPALEGFDEPTGIAAERQADQLAQDAFRGFEEAEPEISSTLKPGDIEPDWKPYMSFQEGDTLVPVNKIRPVKVRPEGVKNAVPFMQQAARGEIDKRPAILVKENEDGSYSVRDGNSTYAIAAQAGWPEMPVRIVDDQEYATEQARKAVDRIFKQDTLGKTKRRFVVAKDLERPEFKVIQNRLSDRQPRNADKYMAMATKNHDDLNATAEAAAKELGMDFKRAPVKLLEKINKKLARKGRAGQIHTIADAARTGITARTIEESDAFVASLAKKFHIIDEGWILTPAGYFDRKLIVVFDDGGLGEIQIWPPGMLNVKRNPTKFDKSGHDYYDIANDPKSSPDVVADANAKMIELYGPVQSKLDPSFAQKIGFDAPRAESIGSTASVESSMVRSSESVALARSGDPVQPRSGPDQVTALDPSMATISPSASLKNRNVPSYEITEAGDQILIPGVEPITTQQLMRAASDEPMRGGEAAMPEGGLFDDDAISQIDISDIGKDVNTGNLFDDMDLEVPLGERFDPTTGDPIEVTTTLRDLKAQMDQEDAMIKRLEFCTI